MRILLVIGLAIALLGDGVFLSLYAYTRYQVYKLSTENEHLKHDLEFARAPASGPKQSLQETIDSQAFAGLYQRPSQLSYSRFSTLNLRVDGTALVDLEGSGTSTLMDWKSDGAASILVGQVKYKIEGDDLIDSHGQRWQKVR